jgi:transposase
MACAYSQDLRERLVRAVAGGMSAREAAKLYEVGTSTAIVWVRRWRDTGSFDALPMGGFRGTPLDGEEAWLLRLNSEQPDLTLEEIQAKLIERGVTVALSTIWRFFHRRSISFKKNGARRRARTSRRQGRSRGLARDPGIA